ncbi:MAG: hypothetical protein UH071_02910 [Paludibacteraceae bacterium]|nr:hypothetical protein [Paludibacteraceae bacterium]
MANIKSLQMWENICSDNRINVCKSFFGLLSTVKYAPTGSVIEAKRVKLSIPDGQRLHHILQATRDNLSKVTENFRINDTPNGNYMLEACVSQDASYAVMHLLQYKQSDYEYKPVSDVIIYEGEDAKIINQLF